MEDTKWQSPFPLWDPNEDDKEAIERRPPSPSMETDTGTLGIHNPVEAGAPLPEQPNGTNKLEVFGDNLNTDDWESEGSEFLRQTIATLHAARQKQEEEQNALKKELRELKVLLLKLNDDRKALPPVQNPQSLPLPPSPMPSQPTPLLPAPQPIPLPAPLLPPPQPVPPTTLTQSTNPNPHLQPAVQPPSNTEESVVRKMSEINRLETSNLEGLGGETVLNIFTNSIESYVKSDEKRIEVAVMRSDALIGAMLTLEKQSGNLKTWAAAKKLLHDRFTSSWTVTQAMSKLAIDKFDLYQDPKAYINELSNIHGTLKQKYPNDIRDREGFIKERLHAALPRRVKATMEPFRSKVTSLQRYQELLEAELRIERAVCENVDKRVLEVSPNTPTVALPASVPSVEDKLAQFQKKLEGLAQQVNTHSRTPKPRYCGYCNTRDHTPRYCPLKPPPGSCFDCLRLECRKGRPGCPGREARNPPQV